MKNGVFTTEFWVTAIVSIVMAIVAIVVARGFLSKEEGDMWVELSRSLVLLIVPIVLAYTAARYTQARTDLKKHNGN